MNREQIVFEVLEQTGLNWTVEKRPLNFNNPDGSVGEVPDAFATVRKDTNLPLGVVGNKYKILQNFEAVETVYDAGDKVFDANAGFNHPWNNSETLGSVGNIAGGSLKGGTAIFVQMELPETYIGKSGVKRYITATNKHDGSASLGFGTANQVICCENTFAIANKELSKIRHTESMTQRVDDAVIALRKILQFEEKQLDIFEKASKVQFGNAHVRQVMETLFGKDKLDNPNASTKLKNQVKEFALDVDTSVVEQGETLWALFNAVTRYTNHSRKTKDKDYSLMFGTDAQINQKAYQLMEAWVS